MPRFGHAVVLGGSISGLLAAAAASRSFDRVTIVDRDELLVEGPGARAARRGVPQSDQVHHLLSLGEKRMEALLPGLGDELIALGCERYDDVADFSQYVGGAWRMRIKSDLVVTMFRRPLFEWAIRRRVLALPGVEAVKGLAVGLIGSDDGTRVIGAKVRGVPGGELVGDFVVDATGRGSRSANWIEDLGFEKPVEQHVRVYMGYSAFTVKLPEGALPQALAGIGVSSTPANPVGAAIRPCGNGLHDVVAYGMSKNYPPDDFDGLKAFFEALPSPLIAHALEHAEIQSEVSPYQMPGNQRRLWEEMPRQPERFVVVGDAVTSFNPVYGQGMTMAAIDATVLGDALAEATELDGVAKRVQDAIGPFADVAWTLSVSTDAQYPGAEFENTEPPSDRDVARQRAASRAASAEGAVRVAARATALHMDLSYNRSPIVQAIVSEWLESGRLPDASVTDALVPPGVTEGVVRTGDLLGDRVL
ncbi:MAG: FAD-dependent monooxygenase [Microbacterium sp.]